MMKSLIMHFSVAALWLLLMGGGLTGFVVGLVLAYLLLVAFRSVLGSQEYVRRCGAFVLFLCVFMREFVVSNVVIAKAVVLRKVEDIHPNFITYDVSGMYPWEIILLSQCITLTPGTTSVDLIDEGETLIVHAFDADDPAEVRQSIDDTLKKAILRFSR